VDRVRYGLLSESSVIAKLGGFAELGVDYVNEPETGVLFHCCADDVLQLHAPKDLYLW